MCLPTWATELARKPRKIAMTFNLDPHHVDALDRLAEQTGMARSELVREALDRLLEVYRERLEQADRAGPTTPEGAPGRS